MARMLLREGVTLGAAPSTPGPILSLSGGGVAIYLFQPQVSSKEVEALKRGRIAYGVLVQEGVPFLLLDIEDFGEVEIAFNIRRENQEKRDRFFTTPMKDRQIRLILCEHPSSVVRGLRLASIRPKQMLRLKDACFRQLMRYRSPDDCLNAIDRVYKKYDGPMMRSLTLMYKTPQ